MLRCCSEPLQPLGAQPRHHTKPRHSWESIEHCTLFNSRILACASACAMHQLISTATLLPQLGSTAAVERRQYRRTANHLSTQLL